MLPKVSVMCDICTIVSLYTVCAVWGKRPMPPHAFRRFLNKINHIYDLFSHKMGFYINIQYKHVLFNFSAIALWE